MKRGTNTMQILLVDDHTLFREALRNLLEQNFGGRRIIEAASPQEAFRYSPLFDELDMVLLDLDFPEYNGLEALPTFRLAAPATPVVVLSASEKLSDVRHAFRGGAAGYIPKTISGHAMLEAIRQVLAGDIYLPAGLAVAFDETEQDSGNTAGLTGRQLEILQLMADGRTNKAIARMTGITEGTVKLHVTAVLKALGAGNRTEAVVVAGRMGLLGHG